MATSTINRINNYKIRRGQTNVSFSNGYGTLTHNGGFTDANSYSLTYNFTTRYIVAQATNSSGNATALGILDYTASGQIVSNFSGTVTVNWVAIGL